jgi:hypothetical protein
MAYRDVTHEFIYCIEDEANNETFRLVREIVGVMIANERAEALGIYHRNNKKTPIRGGEKRPEHARAWQSVDDYDAVYTQWESTNQERATSVDEMYENYCNGQQNRRNNVNGEIAIIETFGIDITKPVREIGRRKYLQEKCGR